MSSINEFMTHSPACCAANTPLQQVAQMMIDHDCGQIPIVDQAGAPVGVVTDRDIAVRIVACGRDASQCTAQDAMTSPVQCLHDTASLSECLELMERSQIRRVPVIDANGALTGMVAVADIARDGKDRATAEVVKEISECR